VGFRAEKAGGGPFQFDFFRGPPGLWQPRSTEGTRSFQGLTGVLLVSRQGASRPTDRFRPGQFGGAPPVNRGMDRTPVALTFCRAIFPAADGPAGPVVELTEAPKFLSFGVVAKGGVCWPVPADLCGAERLIHGRAGRVRRQRVVLPGRGTSFSSDRGDLRPEARDQGHMVAGQKKAALTVSFVAATSRGPKNHLRPAGGTGNRQ